MGQAIADIELKNNETAQQLELNIEGQIAFVAYEILADNWVLTHTEVPETLGGKGVGKILAEKVFTFVEQSGKKARVLCPFLVKYIARHKEWERITI